MLRALLLVSSLLVTTLTTMAQSLVSGVPNSEIRTIASEERDHYLKNFRHSYAQWCKDKKNVCVAELLIRPNGMNVPSPYDQIRLDFVSNLNNNFESARYEHEHAVKLFPPRAINFSKTLRVLLSPFVWNRVEIRSKRSPRNLAPLTEWANRRMDIADSKVAPKGELIGAVHSIAYPSIKNGYWQTVIDFGSADEGVLEDLLALLETLGVTEVEVGSFSGVQQ